jgi:hypothetical protein
MRIDYSLPEASSSYYYLDAPFRYGFQHLQNLTRATLAEQSMRIELLTICEKIQELVLGILEMLPIIGHLVAYIEKKLCDHGIRVIRLTQTDPYQMGLEQAKLLKDDIQFIIQKIVKIYTTLMEQKGLIPLQLAQQLQKNIPAEYLEEMRGISDGSGIPFSEILIANTLSDIMDLFCCSIYAIEDDGKKVRREIATNFFISQRASSPNVNHSFARHDSLLTHTFSADVKSLKQALASVNASDTIRSIIFHVNTRDIELATAGGYAANRPFTYLKGVDLFPNTQPKPAKKTVFLARNLDWPMPLLAQESVLIIRPASDNKKSTAIVSFPGIIGAISGINEAGTSLAVTVVPSSKQQETPNQLIIRSILERADSSAQAVTMMQTAKPASPMNVVIGAHDGIARIELDPSRATTGPAAPVSRGIE